MDRSSRDANMYGSGVASLIGDSGISLDGQSIQLPEDAGYDMQDDVSSIHDSSYWKGDGEPPNKIKIVGTAISSMEEGKIEQLSPSSTAQSEKKGDKDNEKTLSTTLPLNTSQQKQAPNMKNTSKIKVDGADDGKGCLPKWISSAPRWLKFVIAFSTALLVGAVVLVTVALSTALASRENNASANSFETLSPGVTSPQPPSPTNSPNVLFTSTPTAPTSTTTLIFETDSEAAPSSAPEIKTLRPTTSNMATQGPQQTRRPTVSPTLPPQAQPAVDTDSEGTIPPSSGEGETEGSTAPPTTAAGSGEQGEPEEANSEQQPDPASEPYDPHVTTFFVTGGRYTNDVLAQAPQQLRTLPVRGGTSFLVHLGDWNSPYATRCDRQSYRDVDDLFSNSSIPVYFIPGDNDFNDCPDPNQAMSFWHEYLLEYETEYWDEPEQWAVDHGDPDFYPENFAFLYNEILFVGINLVGGVVHNATEWETRQAANLDWIDDNFKQHKDNMKAFVLFAHADPDVPSNSPFYEPFKERVKKDYNKVPVVLIHRNLGVEPWSWETEFENIDNFSVVVVAGSVWPPLMGAVDFRQERPFIFDQSNWYDEFIEHQTNNVPV